MSLAAPWVHKGCRSASPLHDHEGTVQELRTQVAASPALAEAPEDDGDMKDLMSALGQESEKVDRLVELLQERGFDPAGILDEVQRCIPACI